MPLIHSRYKTQDKWVFDLTQVAEEEEEEEEARGGVSGATIFG